MRSVVSTVACLRVLKGSLVRVIETLDRLPSFRRDFGLHKGVIILRLRLGITVDIVDFIHHARFRITIAQDVYSSDDAGRGKEEEPMRGISNESSCTASFGNSGVMEMQVCTV